MPLFWRVFGGTVLSIAALACVTAYQQLTGNINEVRGDLGHLSTDLRKDMGRLGEAQADLVRKDEFNTRMKSVWDSLKELRAEGGAIAALRERGALVEQQLKAGDEERKELGRELQRLREARAGDEERRELLRELQALRERLAAMEGRQPAPPEVKPAAHRED
jgi:chromosome segregation ATPase